MPDPVINKLTDLDTQAVSLVHRGANQRRISVTKETAMDQKDFELVQQVAKAAAGEGETALLEAVKKAHPDLAGKELAAAVSAYRALAGFSDNPVVKRAADALVATLKGENPFAGKPKDGDKPEEDEEVEMKKGLPAEVVKSLEPLPKEQRVAAFKALRAGQESAERERIAKAEERIAKAEAEAKAARAEVAKQETVLKAERDARREKEFVAKAEKELSHVPGKPEELGAVLKSLDDVNPQLRERVEGILAKAEAALKESGLLVEKGKAGQSGPPAGAAEEIEKAIEAQEKSAA